MSTQVCSLGGKVGVLHLRQEVTKRLAGWQEAWLMLAQDICPPYTGTGLPTEYFGFSNRLISSMGLSLFLGCPLSSLIT